MTEDVVLTELKKQLTNVDDLIGIEHNIKPEFLGKKSFLHQISLQIKESKDINSLYW